MPNPVWSDLVSRVPNLRHYLTDVEGEQALILLHAPPVDPKEVRQRRRDQDRQRYAERRGYTRGPYRRIRDS